MSEPTLPPPMVPAEVDLRQVERLLHTIFRTARLAPEKADFRPALPLRSLPGLFGADMPTKRKSISKKTRFEVFKRDGFKCQYCGAMAPDVLLEIDHIQPVSKDGAHDILNFLTACSTCNAGKSDRPLSDDTAVKKQQAQLQQLHERREQLEMMLQWRDGLKDIESDQIDVVAKAWSDAAPGWVLNETGRKGAKLLMKKHGLQQVLDAIETASDRYMKKDAEGNLMPDSVTLAWQKVGGICALAALPDDQRRLYYVKAILNKRFDYVPYDVLDDLKGALADGCPIDDMEREAKNCRSWSAFRNWLAGV
jgi:hypothetical protein